MQRTIMNAWKTSGINEAILQEAKIRVKS